MSNIGWLAPRSNSGDREQYYLLNELGLCALADPDTAPGGQRQICLSALSTILKGWFASQRFSDGSWKFLLYPGVQAGTLTAATGSTTVTCDSACWQQGMFDFTATAAASGTSTILTTSVNYNPTQLPVSGKLVGIGVGDSITVSGATGTGCSGLNGTFTVSAYSEDEVSFHYTIPFNSTGLTCTGVTIRSALYLWSAKDPGAAAPIDYSTGDQTLYKAAYVDASHLTITPAYTGSTNLSGRKYMLGWWWVGPVQQPFMIGILADALNVMQKAYTQPIPGYPSGYDAGLGTTLTSWISGIATWLRTTAYDPVSKGLFYGVGGGTCNPPTRTWLCNNVYTSSQSRGLWGEAFGALSAAMTLAPTATLATFGDTVYAANFAKNAADPGYDGIYGDDLDTGGWWATRNFAKWLGFYWGFGRSATWPAARMTPLLQANPPPVGLNSVSCTPTGLTSGATSTCTVTLAKVAGAGVTISLSSNNAALTVPASVAVANSSSGTFTAVAGSVSSDQTALVTATLNGGSQTASLSLVAPVVLNSVSCTPTGLTSGATSTCTVTLAKVAGAGGVTISLSSNNAALTVPASVAIAANSNSVTFAAVAGSVSSDQTALVTATLNAGSRTASLSLVAPVGLSSISCTPTGLTLGATSTCTVTLAKVAGTGGVTISLSSNAALMVPASVAIAANSNSATFTAVAGYVSSDQTALVTATWNRSSQTASLSLVAPVVLSSVSCTPTGLTSGATSTCTVTLAKVAGTGGVTILLSSNNAGLMVPASVAIAANSNSATFTAAAGSVSSNQTALVTATWNGSPQTASLSLVAPVVSNSVSCTPTGLTSGATSTCTVTLAKVAGAGGVTISLSSNNVALTVPASVTVAANSNSATFTAVAGSVSSDQTAHVTATWNRSSQTASLSLVAPVALSSVSCTPTGLTSGATSTCTVTLAKVAGAGGLTISLSSNNAAVTVPASVAIAANSNSATFAAVAGSVSSDQTALVTATWNGGSQTASLSLVAPVALSSVSCTPTGLTSRATSTCTVTLAKVAGTGGVTISLSSNNAALTVPASVAVAANASSATFTAVAGSVSSDQTAVVTATWNRSSQTASLSLVAPVASSSVSCTPTGLTSGAMSTCTVTLAKVAGPGGMTIFLSSNNAALTVPASVAIAANSNSVTFAAVAGSVSSDQTALVTATWNGSSQTSSLSLVAPVVLSSVSCTPTGLTSGATSTCTVTLAKVAGPGGVTISVSSSYAALTVPASVAIAANSNSATFAAVAGSVSSDQTALVTATWNRSWQTASLSLVAPVVLSSVSCMPTGLTSGATSRCTVTLTKVAGAGGAMISLSSDNPALTVPSSVTVAATTNHATFAALAGPLFQTGVVTATLGGSSAFASLGLLSAPNGISSFFCTPNASTVGVLACTIVLNLPAPAGGVTVSIQAASSRLQVPAQVRVLPGSQYIGFVASVTASDQDELAQISATVDSDVRTINVPIIGIRPTSLVCSPTTIQAGDSFTCVVGLNSPNIPEIVHLAPSSDNPNLKVPSPFTTRPGQTQLAFSVLSDRGDGHRASEVTLQFGKAAVTDTVVIVPAAAPVLNVPQKQLAAVGKELTFVVSAIDPSGLSVALEAGVLPAGASFDPITGKFSWTPGQKETSQTAPRRISIHRPRLQSAMGTYIISFRATNSANVASTGSVEIQVDNGRPVIIGLRNAASQLAAEACTPGSAASLLGRWLVSSDRPLLDPSGATMQLGGTRVTANGTYVPLLYASPARVDFVCPVSAPGTVVDVALETDAGTVTGPVETIMQTVAPALYSLDGSGSGQGMVTFSGTSLLVASRNCETNGQPAEPGDTISLLATGLGVADTATFLQARIADSYVRVESVRAVAGMAGVYQVNVTIPGAVSVGDAIPVVLQATGPDGRTIESNIVTIALERAQQ
ncbi:MAG: hypothetical protein LAP87_06785 [Acidobacteriia bacterium]|nr:hypothetical protein [Terriglobia bacterium]